MMKKLAALVIMLCLCMTAAFPVFAQTSGADISGADLMTGVSGSDYYSDDYAGDYSENYSGEYYAEQEVIGGSGLAGKNFYARVTEVLSDTTDEGAGYVWREQQLMVELLDGPRKGSQALVAYDLSDTLGEGSGSKPVGVGDKVIVQVEESADGFLEGYVTMFVRQNAIIWLGVVFVLMLLFVGGTRGLRSLVALLITCLGLICIMIPLILRGFSPVWASILACIFSIAVTLVVVYGFSVKSLAAALGSAGGVLVSGIIVLIMNSVMKMTGVIDDDSMYLAMASGEIGVINLTGVLFAAIIVGVLGGAIDVSVSIASALEELKINAPNMTGSQLMKSGVNIGVDIMGASLNTLILSYVGGAIHVMLIFYAYQFEPRMVFNDEMIVCELLRALAGSFALLFTVPITAFVSAMMMSKGRFGKFSWDCFASVVILRRFCENVTQRPSHSARTQENARIPREEAPENLYKLVHDRSKSINFEDEYDGYDNSDHTQMKK